MIRKIKNCIIGCIIMLAAGTVFGQELIVHNTMLSSSGILQKEQCWMLLVSNPAAVTRYGQVSLTVVNKLTGQRMLTAITNMVTIPPGARQFQIADVTPVVYNVLSSEVDLNGPFLLPAGYYSFCYEITGEKGIRYAVSCIDARVDPLSPPELILPENKAVFPDANLSFSWLPPAPVALVRNCLYELKVVKVLGNQTPLDAIRDNVPVYTAGHIENTFYNYPSSAAPLEMDQVYAWQVSANTNSTVLKTEVWTFSLAREALPLSGGDGNAYVKLAGHAEHAGYAVVSRVLKFSYLNEGMDSVFVMKIQDVTQRDGNKPVKLNQENLPVMKPGLNLVNLVLPDIGRFAEGHMYEFCLTDKQGLQWKMLFEYRRRK